MFCHIIVPNIKTPVILREIKISIESNIGKINMSSIDQVDLAEQMMVLFKISECSKEIVFANEPFISRVSFPCWLREN